MNPDLDPVPKGLLHVRKPGWLLAEGVLLAAALLFLSATPLRAQGTNTPPSITSQPTNQTVQASTAVNLSVTATGDPPLSFQWLFNGTNLPGATDTSLSLTNAQPTQAGVYAVQVTNAWGSTVSSNAALSVISALINIDFAADPNNPEVGIAATGISTNDYWNPLVFGKTNLSNLQFANQLSSGTGVSVNRSTRNFSLGAADSMYNTYLYNLGVNPVVTITNLTPSDYDIIIYGHGNADNQCGIYSLAVDNLDYGTNSTVAGPGWASSIWQEGAQFVVFHGVTITNSAQVLTVAAYVDPGGYTLINGMQILAGRVVITPSAPAITQQPQSQAVGDGGITAFTASVIGTSPLNYQWFFNGTNLPGSTNTMLILTNVQDDQAGLYAFQVTNMYGAVLSSNASLTVTTAPPSILTQPQSETVAAGDSVTFSVLAAGTSPLSYQWLFNATNVPDATNSSLALANVQAGQTGPYSVEITNIYGSVLSANASLTLGSPPSINVQPQSQTVKIGAKVTFNVTPTGTAPLRYQWLFNTTNLPGATNVSLTLTNAQTNQSGLYAVEVTNLYGSILSSNAVLTVAPPPSITTQPLDQIVGANGTATFSVTATGISPLSYQWRFNGTNLSGNSPASALTIYNVQTNQAGPYSVLVTNLYGSVLSSNATLTVVTAPVITQQPTNQTVAANGTVTFSAAAVGSSPLHYQWLFNGTNLPGSSPLSQTTLHNVQPNQAGPYSLRVTNIYGSVFSSNAVLTVIVTPPSISTQPLSQTVAAGTAVTFSVIAAGSSPFAYQWIFNGTNLPGATLSSLTLANAQSNLAGPYSILVTNFGGSVLSSNATLTVTPAAPWIIVQPQSQTVPAGSTVSLGVSAGGTAPLNYQWLFNTTNLPGATGPQLTLTNVQAGLTGTYAVQVSNLYDSVLSSNAVLTVAPAPPTITVQPQSQFVPAGGTVTLRTTATGTSPLAYQWLFDNTNLAGATSASLTITYAQTNQAGTYAVQVTNDVGSTLSSNATLSVISPFLINIDFVANQQQPEVGLAATGISTNDYWNPLFFPAPNLPNLLYANGLPSYSGLSVSPNYSQYFLGTSDSMYNTYMWWQDGTFPVTVTNLLPCIYDVYIYGHGYVDIEYGNYSLAVDNFNYGTNSTLNGPGWASPVWQEGVQYVVFRAVTITNAAQSLNLSVLATPSRYAVINGMQIAPRQAPAIVNQPQSLTIAAGGSAIFSATALGNLPLIYQWLFNGTNLPAATNSTLNLTNVGPGQVGTYSVMVTNSYGSVTSSPANLNTLTLAASGAGLTLTWLAAGPGYVLQSATNLAPPVTWTTVTNIPTTNGPACVLTLPVTPGGSMFYRLSPSP